MALTWNRFILSADPGRVYGIGAAGENNVRASTGLIEALLCVLAIVAGLKAALADDETKSTPANTLIVRCLLLVRAESSFPPSSSRGLLKSHQLRMRKICRDWHALAMSGAPDREAKGAVLLERCLSEAPFDLARAHQLYYEQNVRSLQQVCWEFHAVVSGDHLAP